MELVASEDWVTGWVMARNGLTPPPGACGCWPRRGRVARCAEAGWPVRNKVAADESAPRVSRVPRAARADGERERRRAPPRELRADLPPPGGPRRPVPLPGLRDRRAALAAARRGAPRSLSPHARPGIPRGGARPPAHRATAAGPARAARARGPAPRGGLRARTAARRGPRPRLERRGARPVDRRGPPRPRAVGPRGHRAPARGLRPRSRWLRRDRDRRRARAPRRPGLRARPVRGAARAGRGAGDRAARPRLAHRPGGRVPLVGLHPRALLPDPARHAARAGDRPRAEDRRRAAVRPLVHAGLLAQRAGRPQRRGGGGRRTGAAPSPPGPAVDVAR